MEKESHDDRLLTEMESFWRISSHGDSLSLGEIDDLALWRSGGISLCIGEVKLSYL